MSQGGKDNGGFERRIKEFVNEHDLADETSGELSYDPSIVGGDRVDVSAAEGIVTLKGEVDSLAQHWAMERAVRRVAGVRGEITISSSCRPPT